MTFQICPYILLFWALVSLPVFSPILCAQGELKVIGLGNASGVSASNSDAGVDPLQTLMVSGFLPNHNAASRFSSQATFGANFELIEQLTSQGLEDWIDTQFTLPTRSLRDAVEAYHQYRKDSLMNPEAGASLRFWDFAWWQYHMTEPDLLRQRVAFALSEILVISQNSSFGDNPYAFGSYYDVLLSHAFGNYRDLLEEVTYHPTMGVYLTYMNNPHTDSLENRFPDENYAREVMQLFTIGLFMLNNDGSVQVDGSGNPISTYDNSDIAEFSKIFTGLMWGDRQPVENQFFKNRLDDTSYTIPMQMLNLFHEPGEKYLLNGYVVPDRVPLDGDADIQDAIDNLFNHPNVGPFIGKLLIQRLVTSNPSHAYVSRVSNAFNDNGMGVRGDMKAVLKAILLDPEARNCDSAMDPTFGHLREPFIRYVQMNKAFDLMTASGNYRNAMHDVQELLSQKPFTSPSVFNFFQPDHQPIGPVEEANLVAPEFQLANSATITGYFNGLNDWMVRDNPVDEYTLFSGETIPDNERAFFDLEDELALATDDRLHELLDRLDLILAQGRLSESTKQLIINVIKQYSSEDEEDLDERVRTAIYLVMVSPEYLINR